MAGSRAAVAGSRAAGAGSLAAGAAAQGSQPAQGSQAVVHSPGQGMPFLATIRMINNLYRYKCTNSPIFRKKACRL